MRIGNYTAQITPGTEDEHGYIAIKMVAGRSPFSLKLTNDSSEKSKVNVRIHGIDQGTWVLMPHQIANIERPVHLAEKFCAYAVGSEGGNAIDLTDGDPHNGLIQIVFTPAKRPIPPPPNFSIPSSPAPSASASNMEFPRSEQARRSASYGAAGVGTEGESSQTFQTVNDFETEATEAVTINLRIVELKTTPRPLSSALSNSIPPAI
jgi:hypothetical protein